MRELEQKLGYTFQDKELLQRAMTHSSYANEHAKSGVLCNERLEFLGDAVLGLTAARRLYLEHPEMPEGEMTRLRAELVCEQSLSRAAESLGLGSYLLLGKGEAAGGGRKRASILADATEALIAALYLDSGMEQAAEMISRFVLDPMLQSRLSPPRDYKTALQELVQSESGRRLRYEVVGAYGPDHNKVFQVEAYVNDVLQGRGEGHSKKEAEQAAAKDALARLEA